MRVIVLGSAQDGGFPQWDCNCINCRLSRSGKLNSRLRSSLALEDDLGNIIVLDASPDLKHQVSMMKLSYKRIGKITSNRISPIDAVLITHAHWGHIMGLLEFSAGASFKVPVYCSSYVSSIIQTSPIFKSLVDGNFIRLIEFKDGFPLEIVNYRDQKTEFVLEAFKVQHREDITDTYGFKIFHNGFSIAYIPDIKVLDGRIVKKLSDVDILFFEGTFYWDDELWRVSKIKRTSKELGHIPIVESLPILSELNINMKYYIHFNHTNPVLRGSSDERKNVEDAGIKVVNDGLVIDV